MIVLIVIVVVVLLLLVWAMSAYNGLVTRRNRVENAWATIDVQLKRRYDLIPNLVETVKGYAKHEREVLNSVTAARAAAMDATGVGDRARAESDLSQALFSMRAVSENYPELRASDSFGQLSEELTNTEDKIAFARQAYNDTVNRYDTQRQRVPANVIANLGGFQAFEYFEADPDSRSPVQVAF